MWVAYRQHYTVVARCATLTGCQKRCELALCRGQTFCFNVMFRLVKLNFFSVCVFLQLDITSDSLLAVLMNGLCGKCHNCMRNM